MAENMIENTDKTRIVLLHELKRNPTHKNRKRVGRGPASGSGKTCGRGYNGQKCRSGFSKRLGFEGGQMPLIRRIPKRGFTNIFKKDFKVVNLDVLNTFDAGTVVTPSMLVEKKIVKGKNLLIKILGNDEITKSLTVEAHKFSKTAKEKIEAAGGSIKVIE